MTRLTRRFILGASLLAILAGTGIASVPDTIEIEAKVSPHTIFLDSDTPWLTVHTDIAYWLVERESLELSGLPVAWTTIDDQGNLVAKFDMAAVKERIAPPVAIFELTGRTTDGVPFAGTDTVTVRERGR